MAPTMKPLDIDLDEYQDLGTLVEFNVTVYGASKFFIDMLKGLIKFLCERAGVQTIVHDPVPSPPPPPIYPPTPWVIGGERDKTPWGDGWGTDGQTNWDNDSTAKFKQWVVESTAGEINE